MPKITNTYGKDVFNFYENSIVIKIPFTRIQEFGDKVGDKLGDKVGDKFTLTNSQARILSEIRNNPNITKPELAKLACVSKTTVDNAIATLKEKNIIKRIGANKNGYWQVLK